MLKIFKRKWQLLSWRQDKYFAVFNELWCQLEWERRELFKKHLCLLIYRLVNWCLEVIGKSHGNITILKHRVQFLYVANFYIIHSLSHLIYTIKKKLVVSDSSNFMVWSHQAPLSMGFPRQEYWSGLPFPSPGVLPDPGIEPRSPTLQADFLPSKPSEKFYTTKSQEINRPME